VSQLIEGRFGQDGEHRADHAEDRGRIAVPDASPDGVRSRGRSEGEEDDAEYVPVVRRSQGDRRANRTDHDRAFTSSTGEISTMPGLTSRNLRNSQLTRQSCCAYALSIP
jgi:hypothetical protein